MPHLNRSAGMPNKANMGRLGVGRWDPGRPLSFKILYYFHRIQSQPPLFEYSRSAPGQGLLLVKDYYNYKSFWLCCWYNCTFPKKTGRRSLFKGWRKPSLLCYIFSTTIRTFYVIMCHINSTISVTVHTIAIENLNCVQALIFLWGPLCTADSATFSLHTNEYVTYLKKLS